MATHTVKFTLPERELGKADITFEVRKDKEKIRRVENFQMAPQFGFLKWEAGLQSWLVETGRVFY